jgi:hypothetical protein
MPTMMRVSFIFKKINEYMLEEYWKIHARKEKQKKITGLGGQALCDIYFHPA